MQAKLFCFFFFSLYFILHSTTKDSTTLPALLPWVIYVTSELTTTGNHMVWLDPGNSPGTKLPFFMKKSVTSCLVYSFACSWARGTQTIISFQMVRLVHAICNGNIPNHIFSSCCHDCYDYTVMGYKIKKKYIQTTAVTTGIHCKKMQILPLCCLALNF